MTPGRDLPPSPREGKRRRSWAKLIGVAISAGVVAAAWRMVDWRQTAAVFDRVAPGWILPFIALNIVGIALLALRWRLLIATPTPIPVWRSFSMLSIGLAANATLPGRPGDIIRAVLVKQSGLSSFGKGLASVVLERLADVSSICLMGFLLLGFVPLPFEVRLALALFSVACIGFMALLLMLHRRDGAWLGRLRRRRASTPLGRAIVFLADKIGQFADALTATRDPRRIVGASILTFAAWAVLTAAILLLIKAFELPVPAAAAVLVIVTTNLGAAIPSSPGNIGIYHFLAVLALSVWTSDRSAAVAFAVAAHLLSILTHIALGLVGAWAEGIQFLRVGTLAAGVPQPK